MYDSAFKSEVTIIIAEDDDGHAELIDEQLNDAGVMNKRMRFKDGKEVWDFLSCSAGMNRTGEKVSYVLLLDIRMPRMDGIEVLKRIKNNDNLKKMPVIILSTTDDPHEIEECYALGCNLYITKPVNFMKFSEIIRRLGLFIVVIEVADINR